MLPFSPFLAADPHSRFTTPAKPQSACGFQCPQYANGKPPALAACSSGGAIRLDTTTKRLIVITPVIFSFLL